MKKLMTLAALGLLAVALPLFASAEQVEHEVHWSEVYWNQVMLSMPGMADYAAENPKAKVKAIVEIGGKQTIVRLPLGRESMDVTRSLASVLFPDGGDEPVDDMIIVIVDCTLWPHVYVPCTGVEPGDEPVPGVIVIGVGDRGDLYRTGRDQWTLKAEIGIPGAGDKSGRDDMESWSGVKTLFR